MRVEETERAEERVEERVKERAEERVEEIGKGLYEFRCLFCCVDGRVSF